MIRISAPHSLCFDISAAKNLICGRGAESVFFTRFIFGLRTVAGPLAGMLGMESKRFVVFNLLGTGTWVTAMAFSGYAFANEFQNCWDTSKRPVGEHSH